MEKKANLLSHFFPKMRNPSMPLMLLSALVILTISAPSLGVAAAASPIGGGGGMCANVTIPATDFRTGVMESFELTVSEFLFSPTYLSTKTPNGSQPCSSPAYFARYDSGYYFCSSAAYTMSDTPGGCIWSSSMSSGITNWVLTFYIMCDTAAPADGQLVPPQTWITVKFAAEGDRSWQYAYSGTFTSRAVCAATPPTTTTARSHPNQKPLFRIPKKEE